MACGKKAPFVESKSDFDEWIFFVGHECDLREYEVFDPGSVAAHVEILLAKAAMVVPAWDLESHEHVVK